MNAAESKLKLLQLIIDSNDKSFIDRLSLVARSLQKSKALDWADSIPSHILNELKLSIDEADSGSDKATTNTEMLTAVKKDFPNLGL